MTATNRQFLVRTGLNLPAGTSNGLAPLTFQAGINLSTPLTGSVEWDGYNLYVSEYSSNKSSTAAYSGTTSVRRTVAYTDSTMTPAVTSYAAAGTDIATATQTTTDVVTVTSSSTVAVITDPASGIILPPALPGRTITVNNASPNVISVYPTPSIAITGASGTGITITITSTAGILPGMLLGAVSAGSGTMPTNTFVVSVISATQFSVNNTVAISGASFTLGSSTFINTVSLYNIVGQSTVLFLAVDATKWVTTSAAPMASNNGGGAAANITAGSLMYAANIYGQAGYLPDIANTGVPLLSGGLNTPPLYGAINLSNSNAVTGILGIANGGTGSGGSALLSNSTVYNAALSSSTVNIGNQSSSTTNVNNFSASGALSVAGNTTLSTTTITGNLTVTGTQFIVNSTISAYSDPIIELQKPSSNGWISASNTYDVGTKYNYYTSSPSVFIVTGATVSTNNVTLTLADPVQFPIGTVIKISSSIGVGANAFIVTSSSLSSVTFDYGSAPTVNNVIGTVTVQTSIAGITTGTSLSGTTATIAYTPNNSQVLVKNNTIVTLTGFTPSELNNTFTVQSSPAPTAGSFVIPSTVTGTITTAGTILINNIYGFAGYAHDTSEFEFYGEGYENNSQQFSGQYGGIKAGTLTVSPAAAQTPTNIAAGSGIQIPNFSSYDVTSVAAAVNSGTNSTVMVGKQTIYPGITSGTVTYTTAASLYIADAPAAGNANLVISTAYALQIASGNTLLGGNLAVNGGNITSTAATLNIAASTSSAIATAVYIASNTAANTTTHFGSSSLGGNTISIDSTGTGTATLDTGVTSGVGNIFTGVTNSINIGGANTTVNIGKNTGNSTLNIVGNSTSGSVTVGTTTGVGTASLFNTIVTTGNIFGTATTVNISANVGSATMNFATNTGNNTIKIGAQTGFSAILDTPTADAIGSLFPSITGTVELAKGAAQTNIGKAGASVTIGTTAGNSVLTLSGQVTTGAVTVTTTTGVASATLFNTIVSNGYLFGAATNINIGAGTSNAATVNILTQAAANSLISFGASNNTGTNTIKINNTTGGTAVLDTPAGAAQIFPTTTGTVGLAIGSSAIIAGAAGSTVTIGTNAGNSTLVISGVNGTTGTSTIDTTTGTITANVYNTKIVTGNIFGTATTVNIAANTVGGATVNILTASTSASLISFGTAITAGINTVKINAGLGGTASLDTSSSATGAVFPTVVGTVSIAAAATAVNIASATATVVTIGAGNGSGDSTLKINGSTTGGTAILNTNVTTGTVSVFPSLTTGTAKLFTGTTGNITIGGSSYTAGGTAVVYLGVSPAQTATGNEVVTAQWVLNNVNSINSFSIDLGTANASTLVDTTTNPAATGAFVTTNYRSAKYVLNATQVYDKITRSQTSEILTTHDLPFTTISGFVASVTASATVTLTSTTALSYYGLYVGMTVAIINPSTSEFISGGTGTITTITAGTSFIISTTSGNTTILSTTVLRAYVANPSFNGTLNLTNGAATLGAISTTNGVIYPGMKVTLPDTLVYTVSSISTSGTTVTGTLTTNYTGSSATGGAAAGTPNITITEYAVLETYGTVMVYTVNINASAPYNLELYATPQIITTYPTGGAAATIGKTLLKVEKELIEYYNM